MATLEEQFELAKLQLDAAKKLLGERDLELQEAKTQAQNILLAGQQLMMAVCVAEMLKPLGEIVAQRQRPLALVGGKLKAATMAVTTRG